MVHADCVQHKLGVEFAFACSDIKGAGLPRQNLLIIVWCVIATLQRENHGFSCDGANHGVQLWS